MASPPEATWLQTELGRAVPAGGGPATLTQAAPPPTATVAGPSVRLTTCALFVLGSIRYTRPASSFVAQTAPAPTATQFTPTSSGIRARELQAGVDTPHEATERVRRPDVAGANGERAEAFRRDRDPLRDRVRARIDLRDAGLPKLDHPDAAASGGDAHRLDALHPAADTLVGSRVDPVDAQVGADHPDRIACHRDVLQQPGQTVTRCTERRWDEEGNRVNNDARLRVEARDALRVARGRERASRETRSRSRAPRHLRRGRSGWTKC